MKTTITAILCLCLTALPLSAQTNNPASDKIITTCQFGLSALVLTALAVSTAVVIYIHHKCPKVGDTVTLVLERSYDHSTWDPIYTNTVTLNGTNRLAFFTALTTDDTAFYRTRLVR